MKSSMKLLFILGTRPEILKLVSVIREAERRKISYTIIHTGQHYDHNMSEVFFESLDLPEPDLFLEIGSGSQGYQTGEAITQLDSKIKAINPSAVVVVGDTNAGLSGAIAAAKLNIPVVHYESGCRSYDFSMPEEINRRAMDAISRYCFAPSQIALDRLQKEGKSSFSYLVGDTLVEIAMQINEDIDEKILKNIESSSLLKPYSFGLMTLHRGSNTDNKHRLKKILNAANTCDYPIVFPVHPRTKKKIKDFSLEADISNLIIVKPQAYKIFLALVKFSNFVITDSGGLQQEAAIFSKPCLTVRNNTEWMETVMGGNNQLISLENGTLIKAIKNIVNTESSQKFLNPFPIGAANKSLDILESDWKNGLLKYPESNFLEKDYSFFNI